GRQIAIYGYAAASRRRTPCVDGSTLTSQLLSTDIRRCPCGRDGQQVPRCMRQPLLAPAPIDVLVSFGIRQVELDALVCLMARGDAVDDPTWKVGVLPARKEAVFRIVAPGPMQHRRIEWIEAQYPIQLIAGKARQPPGECRIIGEQSGCQACG